MESKRASAGAVSIVLEAHLPYVKEYPYQAGKAHNCSKENKFSETECFTNEEGELFEVISETLLPLLEVLEKLEQDHVHYRLALVLSPLLCQMLCDDLLQNKYLNYLDKQIEFGKEEIKRTKNDKDLNILSETYHEKIIERKNAFILYEKNLLKAFDAFKRKGKLEILASCATHAFLPAIENNPESIQAQIEIPVSFYRKNFGFPPQGFWLPNLGWTSKIEPFLRAYNFSYTILETSGLLFGFPAPQKGVFYPAKTPQGTLILARDYYSSREIEKISSCDVYRNNKLDAGYELPSKSISSFLTLEGERRKTGYKYYSKKQGSHTVYNPQAASVKIKEDAKRFMENTISRLKEASNYMDEVPISLHANNACNFGRFWHEGTQFLEELFRLASGQNELVFFNPGEYIYGQDIASLQITEPAFSSSGVNGYAEFFINSSCDYLFRHLTRAMERMTEIAERFPDDTGIKERALNQAAREILLAQSLDGQTTFSRKQAEDALRNFTTIYEALGSNYISTEWLTRTERVHNLFPNINYRVFRRKK